MECRVDALLNAAQANAFFHHPDLLGVHHFDLDAGPLRGVLVSSVHPLRRSEGRRRTNWSGG
jgi:hypothetical protein